MISENWTNFPEFSFIRLAEVKFDEFSHFRKTRIHAPLHDLHTHRPRHDVDDNRNRPQRIRQILAENTGAGGRAEKTRGNGRLGDGNCEFAKRIYPTDNDDTIVEIVQTVRKRRRHNRPQYVEEDERAENGANYHLRNVRVRCFENLANFIKIGQVWNGE